MNSGKTSANKRKSGKGKKPNASANSRKPAVSAGVRAGLHLSIPRVMRLLKRDRINARIGKAPAVVMAAVLEYVASEIIECAGEQAKLSGRHRIAPRHIQLALSQDAELGRLCHGAVISEGGVRPHIEEVLLKKGGKGKGKGEASQPTQEM